MALARAAVAALAGVARCDQLEAGRVADVVVGAGDHDLAGLQRLSEAVERLGAELRC
jgi:hypothetical protein